MESKQKSFKDYLSVFGPAVLLVALALAVAYQFVDPAPPDSIVIATGQEEGAYFTFGISYRDILAHDGIGVEVRRTAGSLENIKLLASSGAAVDAAFVQGGTGDPDTTEALVSLGSLYFEPLWVFHAAGAAIERLTDLLGKRIAVGEVGSGTRAVALQLLADNGVTESTAVLHPLSGRAAARALEAGDVDAVFMVASVRSEAVLALLTNRSVELMSFERAEAYGRVHRFLSSIVLPQGVVDFARNIPARDTRLLAPTANLVVRRDLHPALIDLLLRAAAEVHSPGGMFEPVLEFPNPRYLDFPLSKEARRFYESGPPFLQRYLPFWAATLVDRLKVMLVPFIALLIPLFKIMPPLYRWRIRSRVYRWYRRLKAVDPEVATPAAAARLEDAMRELGRIEEEVTKVSVPLSYADELYDLRLHIGLVRDKLEQTKAAGSAHRAVARDS